MDRETGTETQPCPTCDRQLAVVTNEDGSTSPVVCANCYGPAKPEKAAEAPLQRERGVKDDAEDD